MNPKKSFQELNVLAREKLKRRLIVLGIDLSGSPSSDKIDRLLTIKGYKGDYGLERYPCFKVINFYAQASLDLLRRNLGEIRPDVILIGQSASLKIAQHPGLKELTTLIQSQKNPISPLKILVGPRLTPAQLKKVGYDASFGEESAPSEIASFIIQAHIDHA